MVLPLKGAVFNCFTTPKGVLSNGQKKRRFKIENIVLYSLVFVVVVVVVVCCTCCCCCFVYMQFAVWLFD